MCRAPAPLLWATSPRKGSGHGLERAAHGPASRTLAAVLSAHGAGAVSGREAAGRGGRGSCIGQRPEGRSPRRAACGADRRPVSVSG